MALGQRAYFWLSVISRGASEQRLSLSVDCYLVRHGEAFPETQDPRRSLTPTGRASVEQLGRLAAAKAVQPAAIFHSGIVRAKQTAEILAAQLAPNIQVRESAGLRPEDDPAIAAAELEIAQSPIMLVGHLPHMSRLVALLVSGNLNCEVIDFSPASMVCCCREASRWTLAWKLEGGVT
jgi:phosphohistidine phosphatase